MKISLSELYRVMGERTWRTRSVTYRTRNVNLILRFDLRSDLAPKIQTIISCFYLVPYIPAGILTELTRQSKCVRPMIESFCTLLFHRYIIIRARALDYTRKHGRRNAARARES